MQSGEFGYVQAVGAIDGSHVRIKCPPALHDQYINRKLDYSIQCQGVCDSNHKFLDICVGYPGSVHDTRVMYNSPLYYRRLYPPPGYYLLGDGGYPCRCLQHSSDCYNYTFQRNRPSTTNSNGKEIQQSPQQSPKHCGMFIRSDENSLEKHFLQDSGAPY